MAEFVAHRDEIDLLQIDTKQKNKVRSGERPHHLHDEVLAERCFFAGGLDDVLPALRAAMANVL